MTPDQLTSVVTAYAAALVTVAPVVIGAYFKIKGMVEEQRKRIDMHDDHAGIDTVNTKTVLVGDTEMKPRPTMVMDGVGEMRNVDIVRTGAIQEVEVPTKKEPTTTEQK